MHGGAGHPWCARRRSALPGQPVIFAYFRTSICCGLPHTMLSLIRSFARHPALLSRTTKMTAQPGGYYDVSSTICAAAAAIAALLALATRPLRGDRNPVVARDDRRQQRRHRQARQRLQRLAERLQGRPDLQGQLSRHHERRHRGVPRRQRAAHHAGVRGRHRHHDGGDRRREAGVQADEGGRREVRSERLSAGHHRLLLDLEGRDAVVPVQLVLDGDVDQQGRAEEGRHRRDAEDLAGSVRGRQEAEGRRLPDLRLLQRLGDLGQPRAALGLAQRAARPPRPTASTASTPCWSSTARCRSSTCRP